MFSTPQHLIYALKTINPKVEKKKNQSAAKFKSNLIDLPSFIYPHPQGEKYKTFSSYFKVHETKIHLVGIFQCYKELVLVKTAVCFPRSWISFKGSYKPYSQTSSQFRIFRKGSKIQKTCFSNFSISQINSWSSSKDSLSCSKITWDICRLLLVPNAYSFSSGISTSRGEIKQANEKNLWQI